MRKWSRVSQSLLADPRLLDIVVGRGLPWRKHVRLPMFIELSGAKGFLCVPLVSDIAGRHVMPTHIGPGSDDMGEPWGECQCPGEGTACLLRQCAGTCVCTACAQTVSTALLGRKVMGPTGTAPLQNISEAAAPELLAHRKSLSCCLAGFRLHQTWCQ